MVSLLLFPRTDLGRLQTKKVMDYLTKFHSSKRLSKHVRSSFISSILKNTDTVGIADFMGCKASFLPTTYAGLPLSLGGVSQALWNLVIEGVENKLASWKAKYLSLVGRIT